MDARGTPLGVVLSGANRHDSMMLVSTGETDVSPELDAVPGVRSGKPGRPRRRLVKSGEARFALPRGQRL